MGFQTYGGSNPAGSGSAPVLHNGLQGVSDGEPFIAATQNADEQDLQAPCAYANLAGFLTGGNCTAAALNVTIPAGTSYFAKSVWITSGAIVVGVPDSATTYLWGCSDGIIRPTTTLVLPTGFDAQSACLLVKAVAVSGVITLDNTVRQRGRYADRATRKVQDGPLSLDYANAVIDTSGAALQIPAFTGADPTVPSVGVFLWFRTDNNTLGVSNNGSVVHSVPLT